MAEQPQQIDVIATIFKSHKIATTNPVASKFLDAATKKLDSAGR